MDQGFFYEDMDSNLYRVLFADGSIVKLGEISTLSIASDTTSVLFANKDGDVFKLPHDRSEIEKIGTSVGACETVFISNDGQISVWQTETDDEIRIMYNEGEDCMMLETIEINDSYIGSSSVSCTKDQEIFVVKTYGHDKMWIKKLDEEFLSVKLGSSLASYFIYADNAPLWEETADAVSSLYVTTEDESEDYGFVENIYHIDLKGERERVLGGILKYQIINGYIVYINTDNDLYYADLDRFLISNESKIASDVTTLDISYNGEYIYYMKDLSKEGEDTDIATGSLYCYKIGEEGAEKVTSAASCFKFSSGITGISHVNISIDGSSIYYYVDMMEIKDTGSQRGTLMHWNYLDQTSERISSEVMKYSVRSSLKSGEVYPDRFIFNKYSHVNSDEEIVANLMYYDGNEVSTIATDILY